ncbi:hypothetical protein JCM10908_004402 [Rhodotorula pacifica]|uniref:uncharacterized protein n=1 Tax=Rhodotorula pacifica TaxID=1495444 RepID=UPI00317082AE
MLGRASACTKCWYAATVCSAQSAGSRSAGPSFRGVSFASSARSGSQDAVPTSGLLEPTSDVAGPSAKSPPSAKTPRSRPTRATIPPKPSSTQIRNILVDYLARGRNADALAFYVEILKQHQGDWSAERAEGFAWLFVHYRQPDLARHAAAAIQEQGFLISTAFASKILRMHKDELIFEPEALARVLEWLSEGLARDRRAGAVVDEGMLETVLEVLKRMGRSDWLEQVFKAYRDTLDEGEIGSARLWSFVIGAKLLDGDVREAEKLFDTWRTGYQANQSAASPPPPAPYLVLLAHYASRPYSGPSSRDPAYRFIALCQSDELELASDYVDLLLRTELSRKQHTSFWSLWKAYDDTTRGLTRSRATWLLAIRAKMYMDKSDRDTASPLRRLVPLRFEQARAPTSRQLFRQLLQQRLAQVGNRPTRRLPNSTADPFITADVLNLLLEHFVATRDWQAATVVLETFRVHSVEPDFKTHGNVVLGVVKQWRRGKVRGRLEDFGEGGVFVDEGGGGDQHPFDDPQVLRARQRGFASVRSQQQGLELIRKILDERKMRVGLWTREADASEAHANEVHLSPTASPQEQKDDLDTPAPATSRWMAQRERRDLEYLTLLLQRCEGVDEEDWNRLMVKAREEILPAPRAVRSSNAAQRARPMEPRPVKSRGARYRARLRERRLHVTV